MSSENKTPNIRLSQWQGHEYIKREDFINDNLIIDREAKDLQDKKVDKVSGKGLSTNDYTDEEKNKLSSLEEEMKTPAYTPPIHNYSSIFSVGEGYDSKRSELDYSESVEDGQVSVGLEGLTLIICKNNSRAIITANKSREVVFHVVDTPYLVLTSSQASSIAIRFFGFT